MTGALTTRRLALTLGFCATAVLVAIYFLARGVAEGLLDWLR